MSEKEIKVKELQGTESAEEMKTQKLLKKTLNLRKVEITSKYPKEKAV